MRLRLVAPTKRKDSTNLQFEQRIPADLKERLVGMTLELPRGGDIVPITITEKTRSIRYSLRATDTGEAKRRQAEAIAYLEGVYANLRANAPIFLTHKQCVALSGELYRSWAADLEASRRVTLQVEADGTVIRDYGMDLEAQAAAYTLEADKADLLEGDALEVHLGPLVGRLLLRRGIATVAGETRGVLLKEFARALAAGMRVRARKAGGDYRPDPEAERFPEWSSPSVVAAPEAPAVSLRGLFKGWWAEAENAGRSVSTKESYETAVEALVGFLGHDDAGRVSADDVVRFKEHLVTTTNPRTEKPLSAKTIKDSYLAGVRRVFEWAVDNRKLSVNPAAGITMRVGKKARVRNSWFSREEINALLAQASSATRGRKEPLSRFEARRWVPWLCAYTGARVGEMVQLRKQDVRQIEGHWVLAITPEAITVKGNQGREVPVHPHLIEMGFLEFVRAAPVGFLFLWSGTDRAAWRTAKNRMVEAARKAVPDPNIAPNHGWRHTFKTIGIEAGIAERVLDAICGHKPRTVGEQYGGVTVAAKAQAMGRFPRFEVKEVEGELCSSRD